MKQIDKSEIQCCPLCGNTNVEYKHYDWRYVNTDTVSSQYECDDYEYWCEKCQTHPSCVVTLEEYEQQKQV